MRQIVLRAIFTSFRRLRSQPACKADSLCVASRISYGEQAPVFLLDSLQRFCWVTNTKESFPSKNKREKKGGEN